jgi:hypothetical protein
MNGLAQQIGDHLTQARWKSTVAVNLGPQRNQSKAAPVARQRWRRRSGEFSRSRRSARAAGEATRTRRRQRSAPRKAALSPAPRMDAGGRGELARCVHGGDLARTWLGQITFFLFFRSKVLFLFRFLSEPYLPACVLSAVKGDRRPQTVKLGCHL